LVLTSAKKGRQYNFESTIVDIYPVHEADVLYLGTDGLIHLHEVKNTAKALRNKLRKHPKQLDNMLDWREKELDKREIRMVIATEAGWTQVFAVRDNERAVLKILMDKNVPLTIGECNLSVAKMKELWYAALQKIRTLKKQRAWSGFNQFYRHIYTLLDAENFLGVSLL
jgi:hypothetical protein